MYIPGLGRQAKALLILCALLLVFSQSGALSLAHGKTHADDSTAKLFAYDNSIPFDMKEVSSNVQDGATVQDIDFAAYSSARGRIKAFLVKPAGKGPFAGILYFHWLGAPNGNRKEFLDEAVIMAKKGTVSLLIQGYFPWGTPPTNAETDRKRVIDETIEVRRALDLLLSQPNVDAKRIAYVGHDYGAMYGSIMSGVDKRVKAFVLLAPIGSFSDWSLRYWLAKAPEDAKQAYRQAMSPIDPIHMVAQASPATILLQFANQDEHISKAEATAYADSASKPKEVKWYEAKHDLDVEPAKADRREWLGIQLGLK